MRCLKSFRQIVQRRIMAQQVLLANTEGLVDANLGQAYSAVKSGRDVAAGMTVR